MPFLSRQSDNEFILQIRVKPNSKKQVIFKDNDYLTISLLSKAIKNKANKELINLLKKKLKLSSNQIQLISGLKNTKKLCKLTFTGKTNENEIVERLIC